MNSRPGHALFAAPALLLFGSGCAAPRSSHLDTAGFYVEYTVLNDEAGEPIALADFRDRGKDGSALDLVDGDRATVDDVLLVVKGAAERPPPPTTSELSFAYLAPIAPAATHRFALLRDGEDKTVHLVEELPPPSATIEGSKRAIAKSPDRVLLTWTKVRGTKVSISLAGNDSTRCRSQVLEPEPEDPGFYVLDTGTLRVEDSKGTCNFAITVTRRKESSIGDPFIGGVLRSIAIARLELELQ